MAITKIIDAYDQNYKFPYSTIIVEITTDSIERILGIPWNNDNNIVKEPVNDNTIEIH